MSDGATPSSERSQMIKRQRRLAFCVVISGLALVGLGVPMGASAECTKDTDCKGDRVCVRGTCEDQAPSRSSGGKGDSCRYANDGECDEPDLCEQGTDTSDCRRSQKPTRDYPRPRSSSPSGPSYPDTRPLFCCDAFGNRRCAVTINPGPPGSPCFCFGQGGGYICQ
jgi:hypothetical protein